MPGTKFTASLTIDYGSEPLKLRQQASGEWREGTGHGGNDRTWLSFFNPQGFSKERSRETDPPRKFPTGANLTQPVIAGLHALCSGPAADAPKIYPCPTLLSTGIPPSPSGGICLFCSVLSAAAATASVASVNPGSFSAFRLLYCDPVFPPLGPCH